MGTDRVLATEQARTTIANMKRTITGGLTEQVQSIANDGTTLSQPDVWDGSLARQFRDGWPTTSRQLREAVDELDRLNETIDRISADIMRAGGNAG